MELKILSSKRRAELQIAVLLAAMVTVPSEASALAREEMVVSESVSCHSSASDASMTIRELGVGERITVAERLDDWVRVGGNPSCWIADAALEGTPTVARERSTERGTHAPPHARAFDLPGAANIDAASSSGPADRSMPLRQRKRLRRPARRSLLHHERWQ